MRVDAAKYAVANGNRSAKKKCDIPRSTIHGSIIVPKLSVEL